MATVEHGELQVVVPVGFLLTEVQEVTVSVDRPGGDPLPVRLRLIPARPRRSRRNSNARCRGRTGVGFHPNATPHEVAQACRA